jgi:hypothetical protein
MAAVCHRGGVVIGRFRPYLGAHRGRQDASSTNGNADGNLYGRGPGEVTLRGQVLPIGGLKEKVIAAHREGIKTVLFPDGNRKDLEEIPKEVLNDVKLIPVKHMDDVLKLALEQERKKK